MEKLSMAGKEKNLTGIDNIRFLIKEHRDEIR